MKEYVCLVCNRYSVDRMLKNKPSSLKSSEYLISLSVEIPNTVFEKPPIPHPEAPLLSSETEGSDE